MGHEPERRRGFQRRQCRICTRQAAEITQKMRHLPMPMMPPMALPSRAETPSQLAGVFAGGALRARPQSAPMNGFLCNVINGRPAAASRWRRIALAGLIPVGVLGCAAPMMPAGITTLTAQPNPSADGAYTLLWSHVAGATKYRLLEDGELAFEGLGASHAVAGQPDGSYTYSLTYCVEAFGIEACNLRPMQAEVTVVVQTRKPPSGLPEETAP